MSDSDKPVTRGEIRRLVTELDNETAHSYDNDRLDNIRDAAIDRVAECLARVFGTEPKCECGHPESSHTSEGTCRRGFCYCTEFQEKK